MATAKKGAASPKKPGTAVAPYHAELAERARRAQQAASNLGTGGNWISIRGGVMKYKGNAVPGNAMNVVVPTFVLENQFYGEQLKDGSWAPKDFDQDSPQSPVCYAFGTDPKTMRPHDKSPHKQHPQCAGCPQNEWGTAVRGRGKACKNVARLALIPASALERGAEGVGESEEAIMKVPVTSCKAWGGYVSELEAIERPPLAFVTEISVTPDPKNQVAVNFKAVEEIEDGAAIQALLKRADVMDKTLAQPYPDFEADGERPAGRNRPVQPAPKGAAAKAPAARARKF